jgi:hypothetical protein
MSPTGIDQTTPRMTHHARQRCAEMGISTKVAKRIYRERVLTYEGKPGSDARVALSNDQDYAVVYTEVDDGVLICSVVFRTQDDYRRNGATFEVV